MSADFPIAGLAKLLDSADPAGVEETRALVAELLHPARSVELLDEQMIWRGRVHRARFRADGVERTLIFKRLPLDRAHREQLAVRRWLPELGLAAHGSPLLGVAAAHGGECIWHVYADLGPHTLDKRAPERAHVAAAVQLLAQLHTRAATCAFLGECREFGVDLGLHFLATGIADAVRALEGILSRYTDLDAVQADLFECLLQRLRALRTVEPERTQLLAAHGGPETLLHGDLWTCNIFVVPEAVAAALPVAAAPEGKAAPGAAGDATAVHIRFIDWDHAGVGHASYDLSALLLRFPPQERDAIVDLYAAAIAPAGWRLPERAVLNALCETAETARLVSAVLWPALSFHTSRPEWAYHRLVEVESWFAQMQPILASPCGDSAFRAGAA